MCKRYIGLHLACSLLGTWPTTQACAMSGNRTGHLLFLRLTLNPLSHTSQGCTSLLWKNLKWNKNTVVNSIKTYINLVLCFFEKWRRSLGLIWKAKCWTRWSLISSSIVIFYVFKKFYKQKRELTEKGTHSNITEWNSLSHWLHLKMRILIDLVGVAWG